MRAWKITATVRLTPEVRYPVSYGILFGQSKTFQFLESHTDTQSAHTHTHTHTQNTHSSIFTGTEHTPRWTGANQSWQYTLRGVHCVLSVQHCSDLRMVAILGSAGSPSTRELFLWWMEGARHQDTAHYSQPRVRTGPKSISWVHWLHMTPPHSFVARIWRKCINSKPSLYITGITLDSWDTPFRGSVLYKCWDLWCCPFSGEGWKPLDYRSVCYRKFELKKRLGNRSNCSLGKVLWSWNPTAFGSLSCIAPSSR